MSAVWAHDLLREIYLDDATPKPLRSSIRARLQPVEVDYRGCRMHVHPADNNTEFQIWKHGRTQEERPLKRILSRLEGRPVFAFDVGANAGSFATRIAAIAGALYVPQVGIINPGEFSPLNSIEIVIWVAVGGRGTLIGAIVAEFFGSPTRGMGFRISTSVGQLALDLVWAEIVVAALVGSAFYGGVALLEKAVTFWHPSQRGRVN